MRLLTVRENEAGQRLDKLLAKYMEKAPMSFFYKMLRKKNITLNGKKASGSERLSVGDEIRLFLADETIDGFSGKTAGSKAGSGLPQRPLPSALCPEILYEDANVILFNKPAGLLSQKAASGDVSLVEYLTDYLLKSGQLTQEDLRTFRPGICNRLDRNTSGLVAAGKSLSGLQELNELFRVRSLHKFYRTIAAGEIKEKRRVEGFLIKNEQTNQVRILDASAQKGPNKESAFKEALPICTEYIPLQTLSYFGRPYTYLEINLITGRSHQIRAHLASLGHPLIGDTKYGDKKINLNFRREFGLEYQLLHAYRLELPVLSGALEKLSKKHFTAPLPKTFGQLLKAGRIPAV